MGGSFSLTDCGLNRESSVIRANNVWGTLASKYGLGADEYKILLTTSKSDHSDTILILKPLFVSRTVNVSFSQTVNFRSITSFTYPGLDCPSLWNACSI